MKTLVLVSMVLVTFISSTVAQQASFFDPAQSYNKLLIERNKGTYTQIGNYKVVGTLYLYGEKNAGDLFSKTESGAGISLRYNTYSQDIEFFPSPDDRRPLIKEPGSLDSFVIKQNFQAGLNDDLHFIYASVLGSKEKVYYQLVSGGEKFNLYKKYSTELGVVSTNYIQQELRQFNLLVDYYYADSSNQKIKKLKNSPTQIVKEFATVKDLSSIINADALTSEREMELIKIFRELNKAN